jgi:hypothetical protein
MDADGWGLISNGGKGKCVQGIAKEDVAERLRICAESITSVIVRIRYNASKGHFDRISRFLYVNGRHASIADVVKIVSFLSEKRDLIYDWKFNLECQLISKDDIILHTIEEYVNDLMSNADRVLR